MPPLSFIILDCETTGLHSDYGDKIIEIALVRYDMEERELVEKERFETLINPEMPLEEKISYITGIQDEDVQKAPLLSEVKKKVETFLQSKSSSVSIIVGHNVAFDVAFLKQSGIEVSYPTLDTLDLAFLFEPQGISLSLESLALKYAIPHLSHRAMGDVLATKELFQEYIRHIENIHPLVQNVLSCLLPKSEWIGKNLFPSISEKTLEQSFNDMIEALQKQQSLEESSASDKDATYHSSLTQNLSQTILSSLENNKRSIISVPSGIGKTFAGLSAALEFARKTGEKVLYLSQPRHDDVQECMNILNGASKKEIAVFENNQYIVSLQKVFSFSQKTTFSQQEILFIVKILLWIITTKNGSLWEISFPPLLFPFVYDIGGYTAIGDNMPDLFLERHAEMMRNAHVVVAWLPSFFTPLNISAFRPFHHIVFENGATLEDQITRSCTGILSMNRFTALTQTMEQLLTEHAAQEETLLHLKNIKDKIPFFFAYLGMYAQKRSDENTNELVVTQKDKASLAFEKIKYAVRDLLEDIMFIENKMQQALHKEYQKNEILLIKQMLTSLLQEEESVIIYLDVFREEDIYIKRVALNIEEVFQQYITDKKSIIMLSSPLIDIKKALSLDNFDVIEIPAPEKKNLSTYLLEDMKVQPTYAYTNMIKETVEIIARTKREKVIFICSNTKLIEDIVMPLSTSWKEQSIAYVAQKISGGELKVKEKYQNSNYSALFFCTLDFFVKMNPRVLQADTFVIQKLPFVYTNGIIDSYRKKKYANDFMEYTLPKSLLRFSDVIGAIMKVPVENKKIFILDNKILTERYGESFINILPDQENVFEIQRVEMEQYL